MAMTLVSTVTIGAGGASSIQWTGIAGTGKDLLILVSGRNGTGSNGLYLTLNSDTTAGRYVYRMLYGTGSTAASTTGTNGTGEGGYIGESNRTSYTADTFDNTSIYISNYASSALKLISADSVTENNATAADQEINALSYSQTTPITSISIRYLAQNFAQYSTASLYIIDTAPVTPKATGGSIFVKNSYVYHAFAASGTFTPTQAITADVLIVGGGGGGGAGIGSSGGGGGGGGGAVKMFSNQSLTVGNYNVSIGAGGLDANGNQSSFNRPSGLLLTAGGGGYGGGANNSGGGGAGTDGASGGGGAGISAKTSAGAGSSPGTNGGIGDASDGGGGGGGSAAVAGNSESGFPGTATTGGDGGDGDSTFSDILSVVGLGDNRSGIWWLGGGGGGATDSNTETYGLGGAGGGGQGTASLNDAANGIANTGGGGGGVTAISTAAGRGGSGLVIVRYAI